MTVQHHQTKEPYAGLWQQFFCLLVYALNLTVFCFGMLLLFASPFSGILILSAAMPMLWVIYRREMEKADGIAPLFAVILNAAHLFMVSLALLGSGGDDSYVFMFLFLFLNIAYVTGRYQSHTDRDSLFMPLCGILLLFSFFTGLSENGSPVALYGIWTFCALGFVLWFFRGVKTRSGRVLRNYTVGTFAVLLGFSFLVVWSDVFAGLLFGAIFFVLAVLVLTPAQKETLTLEQAVFLFFEWLLVLASFGLYYRLFHEEFSKPLSERVALRKTFLRNNKFIAVFAVMVLSGLWGLFWTGLYQKAEYDRMVAAYRIETKMLRQHGAIPPVPKGNPAVPEKAAP